MPLFEPNSSTASATSHPERYAIISAVIVGLIAGIGFSLGSAVWAAILAGVILAVIVGGFNYWSFRPGGWAARWYERRSVR